MSDSSPIRRDPALSAGRPALSAGQVAKLAEEADAAVRGQVVRNLQDSIGGGLLLLIGGGETEPIQHRLLFVAEPGRARVHLARPRRVRRADRPPVSAFTRDAHNRVDESTVVSVQTIPGERIVVCELSGPMGDHRLIAELFGASPNLILVDPDNRIRAAKRHRGGRRPIEVGGTYQAPPPPREGTVDRSRSTPATDEKDPPTTVTSDDFGSTYPFSGPCDEIYQPADAEAAFRRTHDALLKRLQSEVSRAERLVQALAEQAASGDDADQLKESADLLSASFHLLRQGQSEIQVEDHYRGGSRKIRLDPALTPRQNVDSTYRRARRRTLAREGALKRIPAAEERLRALHSIDVAAATTDTELIALSGDLEALTRDRSRPAPKVKGLKSNEKDALKGLRSFRTCSGLEVLVGKTNRDNDFLTSRVARGNDIWLHVQGDAGSHVVIRVPKQRVAAPEDLEDAGALAVHFSKRRGARSADVQFTARKHVKKPKGAAPGAVLLDRFKTLRVRLDERRMARLLDGPDGDGVTPGPSRG